MKERPYEKVVNPDRLFHVVRAVGIRTTAFAEQQSEPKSILVGLRDAVLYEGAGGGAKPNPADSNPRAEPRYSAATATAESQYARAATDSSGSAVKRIADFGQIGDCNRAEFHRNDKQG